MRTVIAIWNSADKGKTETLRELAKLFICNFPNINPIHPIPFFVPNEGDFRCIFEINGKIIGIESQGDPKTNLENRLIEIVDLYNCTTIFCTSRTRGETVRAVDNLFYTKKFRTIWTSTYQIEGKDNQTLANKSKAKHLLDLIENLEII